MKIILICFYLLGSVFNTVSNPRGQAIWYKSYNPDSDEHTIGIKYFNFGVTIDIPSDEDYLIAVKRDTSNSYSQEVVILKNNDMAFAKYRNFLPEITGFHRKHKSYVIYNVQTFCDTCHAEFKIKYFDCLISAQSYYDNLLALDEEVNRKKYFLRIVTNNNYNFGPYENPDELDQVLTNLMECEANATTECCIPYPCLINPTSINCICGYNPNSIECLCAKPGKEALCNAAKGV